jgi:phosphoribosylformylglycinamidine cyclo-ligase
MCVNDILTCGAEPLYFLDYLATGKLDRLQLTDVVAGIAEGCRQAGCALLGGETAEMPGFYGVGEYDLAGFAVGVVEKISILDASRVEVGDVAIGLASTGVHSNGFSLVRKIIADRGFQWQDTPSELGGKSLGDVFLEPTKIYVSTVLAALRADLPIRSMAHITGGGLPENLPRCLGNSQSIKVVTDSWDIPPLFNWLAAVGDVDRRDMFHTFNMGIGYAIIVPKSAAASVIAWLQERQIAAWEIGRVVSGDRELIGL